MSEKQKSTRRRIAETADAVTPIAAFMVILALAGSGAESHHKHLPKPERTVLDTKAKPQQQARQITKALNSFETVENVPTELDRELPLTREQAHVIGIPNAKFVDNPIRLGGDHYGAVVNDKGVLKVRVVQHKGELPTTDVRYRVDRPHEVTATLQPPRPGAAQATWDYSNAPEATVEAAVDGEKGADMTFPAGYVFGPDNAGSG
ncbi:MAG: hypothetical protein WA843_02260 [Candidatus Saccharimonadales bacterium]